MDEKHIHFHQENLYGDKYDIHDNPNATFNFGSRREPYSEGRREDATQDDCGCNQADAVEDLLPFFFNDKAEAKRFVSRTKAMKDVDVTKEVNRLIREKKLSDVSCMKPLWEVMTKHRLYDKKYNTWNAQVKR